MVAGVSVTGDPEASAGDIAKAEANRRRECSLEIIS